MLCEPCIEIRVEYTWVSVSLLVCGQVCRFVCVQDEEGMYTQEN